MSYSVFTETRFWFMVALSVVLPFGIYAMLMMKRAISRTTVLLLGFLLVAIAGLDVYFLRSLSALAALTPSLADDALFISELSIAFYLLPALFGGLGINIISHSLISHLAEAQQRFNKEHPDRGY
ncbi:hypothetical protein [Variovorax sp. PBL-E5]|uniref:hypothetical protein n=1 Tax=Variovorax sp. PBL-E5 TaxID=434014 RepID=UPI001315C7F3|nr:hypothetical protein [Variovorax sp. PBL-E5]VTU35947.1 hypothetical protein E5CHR_04192 [Variovorax sp. PBL-E5]